MTHDIVIPNIFSPNKDNVNDCFDLNILQDIQLSEFNVRIFDRWGNLVFVTDDPQECWDGNFQNNEMVPGVYVYVIDLSIIQCNGIKEIRKIGDVTLIR